RSAAVALAAVAWLAACSPRENTAPEPETGGNAPAIAAELLGPIPLAPSITGTAPAPPPAPEPQAALPARSSAAVPAPPPVPAAPPEPPQSAAKSAPPAVATAPPSRCPPGTVAMLSAPDAAGVPVEICRRPASGR